jgi:allantoin racemase
MLSAEARKAKDEDDAEAILLGCAGFAQFAQELEQELNIPVLDGVVCAVKIAEAVVELGKTTSKHKTYRPPEKKAFTGMFAKFGRS